MPSRADMDRPATVTAALLGIVLILFSLPFLGAGGGGASAYAVSWTEQTYATNNRQNAGQGTDATVIITLEARYGSNATVTFEQCNDGAAAPLQQPATITWSLKAGNQTLKDGQQASCASPGPFTVALGPHPDVGSASGDNATAAARHAETFGAPTTAYTLTFRYNRPAGATGPIPLPPPAFSTAGKLEVKAWHAIANPPQEAGR
jgi:hypothetical protein